MEPESKETLEALESEEIIALVEAKNKEIEALMIKAQEGEKFAAIVTDSDVRKVLEAKESGKSFTILTEDDDSATTKTPSPQEKSSEELDGMTRSELVLYAIEQSAASLSGVIDEKLEGFGSAIESLQAKGAVGDREKLQSEIAKVRKEFPDFKTYAPGIKELWKDNPNLSVRQLYMLARVDKGDGLPGELDTYSEHPGSGPTKPVTRGKKVEYEKTRAGFESCIDDALSEIDYGPILDAPAEAAVPSLEDHFDE